MNKSNQHYQSLVAEHRCWVVAGISILILSIIGGVTIGPNVPSGTLSNTWRTLSGVQAAIIGIVFSVLFITTQLTSNRYSPHFANLFVNDRSVQIPFFIGMLSLIVDIIIPIVSPFAFEFLSPDFAFLYWLTGGLFLGTNLLFLFWLYPLIRLILLRSSPSNALEQLYRVYDGKKYVDEASKAAVKDDNSIHPLQVIFDYIVNSLSRKNLAIASSGTDALYSLSSKLAVDFAESSHRLGHGLDQEDAPTVLFGPLFQEYTIDIVETAHQEGFQQVGKKAIRGVSDVCESSIRESWPQPLYLGFDSLFSKIIEDADSPDRPEITPEIIAVTVESCFAIFRNATTQLDVYDELVPQVAALIDTVKTPSFGNSNEAAVAIKAISDGCENVHRELIETCHSQYSQDELFQMEGRLIGFDEGPTGDDRWTSGTEPKFNELSKCISLLMYATAAGFEIRDRSSEAILPQFSNSWNDVAQQSLEHTSQIHSIYVVRRYLEFMAELELCEGIDGPSVGFQLRQMASSPEQREAVDHAFKSIFLEDRESDYLRQYTFLERRIDNLYGPVSICEYNQNLLSVIREFQSGFETD